MCRSESYLHFLVWMPETAMTDRIDWQIDGTNGIILVEQRRTFGILYCTYTRYAENLWKLLLFLQQLTGTTQVVVGPRLFRRRGDFAAFLGFWVGGFRVFGWVGGDNNKRCSCYATCSSLALEENKRCSCYATWSSLALEDSKCCSCFATWSSLALEENKRCSCYATWSSLALEDSKCCSCFATWSSLALEDNKRCSCYATRSSLALEDSKRCSCFATWSLLALEDNRGCSCFDTWSLLALEDNNRYATWSACDSHQCWTWELDVRKKRRVSWKQKTHPITK